MGSGRRGPLLRFWSARGVRAPRHPDDGCHGTYQILIDWLVNAHGEMVASGRCGKWQPPVPGARGKKVPLDPVAPVAPPTLVAAPAIVISTCRSSPEDRPGRRARRGQPGGRCPSHRRRALGHLSHRAGRSERLSADPGARRRSARRRSPHLDLPGISAADPRCGTCEDHRSRPCPQASSLEGNDRVARPRAGAPVERHQARSRTRHRPDRSGVASPLP